ncbi:hypothetical protein [Azospirillum brasilense]|uniref:hypothetical protein n=1 Tax=Azospirillum brasilense TaxID=192 RepID=UPI0013B448EB|nr:hypothetical protein [Azospirillum brasilense]
MGQIISNNLSNGNYDEFINDSGPLGIKINSFHESGQMSGLGKLKITARELIDVDNRHANYFAVIELKSNEQYERSDSSVIEYDEIDRICAALDRLKLINPGISKFSSTQAEFSTVKGLSFTSFIQRNGTVAASISSGSVSIFLHGPDKFDELKNLLLQTKSFIDRSRISQ